MRTIKGTQLIGKSESALGIGTFQAWNPARRERLEPQFQEATTDEVDRALRLAAVAAPIGRFRPISETAALLERVALELEASRPDILQRCEDETGYPRPRVESEFARMVHHWRLFAEVVREGHWLDACVDRAQPDRQPLPKPDLRRVRVAMGPVVVFGASNFPLALSVAGSDSLTALAAGCPVVVKGHPSHPGTSELLACAVLRAIDAIGLPEGTFSMLQGTSQELGRQLVEHPATQAVGFTGSVRGGRALLDLAAARRDPIPVYAEMGSVNPQFVYPGILAKVASGFAERLFASVTMGNGQFCTCPSLVFVPAGKHTDTFVNRYRALVNASTGGLLLNPGIAAAYQDGIGRWADLKEVSLLARCPISNEGPAVARIDGATFLHHAELFLEEVFGPVTVVVVCESENDYIHLARVFPGQLGCSLHGTEAELAAKALPLMQELQRFAGRIVVNGFPTGIETSLAMHHGGPYPASTNSQHTSLGLAAIDRWTRPVCFQDTPDALLPAALQDANPLAIPRRLAALTAL